MAVALELPNDLGRLAAAKNETFRHEHVEFCRAFQFVQMHHFVKALCMIKSVHKVGTVVYRVDCALEGLVAQFLGRLLLCQMQQ